MRLPHAVTGADLTLIAADGLLVWQLIPGETADPNSAKLVAEGVIVYRQNCARCHGRSP